jgi:Flp pilus assembly pilin Flp
MWQTPREISMKKRSKSRSGQTMVEYIIIVVLIAITLLVLFSRLSKATGKKIAGATSALDAEVGGEAATLADEIDENKVRNLQTDGSFQ